MAQSTYTANVHKLDPYDVAGSILTYGSMILHGFSCPCGLTVVNDIFPPLNLASRDIACTDLYSIMFDIYSCHDIRWTSGTLESVDTNMFPQRSNQLLSHFQGVPNACPEKSDHPAVCPERSVISVICHQPKIDHTNH